MTEGTIGQKVSVVYDPQGVHRRSRGAPGPTLSLREASVTAYDEDPEVGACIAGFERSRFAKPPRSLSGCARDQAAQRRLLLAVLSLPVCALEDSISDAPPFASLFQHRRLGLWAPCQHYSISCRQSRKADPRFGPFLSLYIFPLWGRRSRCCAVPALRQPLLKGLQFSWSIRRSRRSFGRPFPTSYHLELRQARAGGW